MAENALTKLPLAGQLGVAALLAGVIGIGFYFGYWTDAVEQQTLKTGQLETLRKEIQKLEVTASKLAEFQREVAELEQKLETLKQILPAAKETPNLIRRVQALASESRLTIKRFTPGTPVRREFSSAAPPAAARGAAAAPSQDYYQEWPINIDVEGTYHNLGLFFDKVGRLRRLVNVGNVKIRAHAQQRANKTVGVAAVATTYVYVEAPGAGQ